MSVPAPRGIGKISTLSPTDENDVSITVRSINLLSPRTPVPLPEAETDASKRTVRGTCCGMVGDHLILAIMFVAWILMNNVATPHTRGFFKDDHDIGFPHGDTQISNVLLFVIATLIPLTGLVIYNLYIRFTINDPNRLFILWRQAIAFGFGILSNDIVTNALKLMVSESLIIVRLT